MVTFWLAVWTLVERELVRFWRDKARVLGVVASPLLFWMVLGFGAGAGNNVSRRDCNISHG